MTAPLWLKATWEWLKKYWKWLLFPIGVLAYVLGRASAKTTTNVVSPSLEGHEEVKAKLDDEAAAKKQQADVVASQELSAIEVQRAQVVDAETKQQVAEIEAVQGDPQKVTDLLKQIGKDIRSK